MKLTSTEGTRGGFRSRKRRRREIKSRGWGEFKEQFSIIATGIINKHFCSSEEVEDVRMLDLALSSVSTRLSYVCSTLGDAQGTGIPGPTLEELFWTSTV